MNLRQLQYFLAVSEVESVTKAAARLNLAQPALTRHMRTLERDLDVQLFARNGRGISLTDAGAVFRDRVKTILGDLERAQVEVQLLSRSPRGRVEIGMPTAICGVLNRPLLQRMGETLPEVDLRIIDGWTGFIVEWLILGRLDFGIIYDHGPKSDMLEVRPLAMERLFLIAAADDPLARLPSPLPLKHLAELPLALPSREHGLRISVEQQLHALGLDPRITSELESVIAIKQAVQTGGVYTILPYSEIAHEISAKLCVQIETQPAIDRMLSLAWPKTRQISEPIEALIDMVSQEAALLIEAGAWGATYLAASGPAASHRPALPERRHASSITRPV